MIPFPTRPKHLWTALALAAAIALPASAQSLVTTKNFSLTFPAGWAQPLPGKPSDSSAIIINNSTGTTAITYGHPHQGVLSSQEMNALRITYGVTDSLATTDQGTKTLGGKEFTFLEFKNNGSKESDSTSRVRFYLLSQGNFLFVGVLSYVTDKVAANIAEFETALASLNVNAAAGVRAVPASLRPEAAGPWHDALGRSRLLPGARSVSLPRVARY